MNKISVLVPLICFISFSSFAQWGDKKIARLIITYYGDSTLFMEKYEIDFNRKKVFYITPVANYLHIKGGKLKTDIRVNRKEWESLARLGLAIDFKKLLPAVEKSAYSVERISVDEESQLLQLSEENIPPELRTLFKTIRSLR